jgi:acetyltransferase-like isoleucine patch superfamily enzyme
MKVAGFCEKMKRMLKVIRTDEKIYSLIAYVLGASFFGGHMGSGPVAWLRGFPRPELNPGTGSIRLGHVALYPGVKLHCRGQGRIIIEDDSYLNRDTRVFSGKDVVLGNGCMIAWRVIITDLAGLSTENHTLDFAPVVLMDRVWVGSGAVILGGTHIESGCVIAAGSIVQGHFPKGAVIAGRPAEVIS